MELARQITWSDQDVELFHYRTKDGVEVDAVLENDRREVIAIEVKASATVRSEDFRGLRHLDEPLGDDLLAGRRTTSPPSTYTTSAQRLLGRTCTGSSPPGGRFEEPIGKC